MYRIIWINGKEVEEVHAIPDIRSIVNGLGNDGGILEWVVDQEFGIINSYNQIAAYVEYFEPVVVEEKEHIANRILKEALSRYGEGRLRKLLINYDKYVELCLAKGEKVEGLLHYISITKR